MNARSFRPGRKFDAVIIGSGASGGWAALELTRAGLDVAVLEAGPMLKPEQMFADQLPPFRQRYRGLASGKGESPLYVNPTENPYTTPVGRPFNWTRGRHVGGKTLMWSRGTPRMTDFDFRSPALHGYGAAWPLEYRDIKPFYDEVEHFIGVCGRNEGNPANLPDGILLKPQAYTPIEWRLKQSNENRLGRVTTSLRSATLTENWQGRQSLYSAPAVSGRQSEALFSSVVSTLPAAARTGRMHLRPNTVVSHLTLDPSDPRRARGVWCVDRENPGEHFEIQGTLIVLCASTLESTRILLNSVSREHPNGIGNSSGVLGRYLMDHVRTGIVTGAFPAIDPKKDSPWLSSRNIANAFVPRFQNLGDRPDQPYLGGFHAQMWSRLTPIDEAPGYDGFGAVLKARKLREQKRWIGQFNGHGEMLPDARNRCRLDAVVKDRWGIPALHIDCQFFDNDRKLGDAMLESYQEMLQAAGATEITVLRTPNVPGDTVHEVGTARMGHDPKASYLNAFNQSHDVPNLFVTDGAALVSCGNQNPTLTLMALTLRACRNAATELKAGRI